MPIHISRNPIQEVSDTTSKPNDLLNMINHSLYLISGKKGVQIVKNGQVPMIIQYCIYNQNYEQILLYGCCQIYLSLFLSFFTATQLDATRHKDLKIGEGLNK